MSKTIKTGRFLSCDWGSTSLRIRFFDTIKNIVLVSQSGEDGILKVHQQWTESGEPDRLKFYCRILSGYVSRMQTQTSEDLSVIPMVISGMASSSLGIAPLPYAELPFSLNGKALQAAHFPPSVHLQNAMMLISGVRSSTDVMRGEETELIGYADSLRDFAEGLYLLPGTHSKHIRVEADRVIDFATFMTGEVFALLCDQSILRSAIHHSEYHPQTGSPSFDAGVMASRESHLLHSIFQLRASELFNTRSKEDNYFFLSGLMIGHELAAITTNEHTIYLCGQGQLKHLYQRALSILGHEDKTRTFSASTADTAVAIGQYKIYLNQT